MQQMETQTLENLHDGTLVYSVNAVIKAVQKELTKLGEGKGTIQLTISLGYRAGSLDVNTAINSDVKRKFESVRLDDTYCSDPETIEIPFEASETPEPVYPNPGDVIEYEADGELFAGTVATTTKDGFEIVATTIDDEGNPVSHPAITITTDQVRQILEEGPVTQQIKAAAATEEETSEDLVAVS